MTAFNKILWCICGTLASGLALWFGVSFWAQKTDYLALVRGGMLLIGLAGAAWGLLWHRPRVAWLGVVLLAIGFFTFFLDGWASDRQDWSLAAAQPWYWSLQSGLHRPLNRAGTLCLWHLGLAGLIAINAMLLANRACWRRHVGATLVVLAAVFLLARAWSA